MTRISRLLFVLMAVVAIDATAEGRHASVGDSLDLSSLKNQHGEMFAHGQAMEILIFVRDMDTGDLVAEALVGIDTGCMADGRLVYVADISKMPGLISRMVAIPKMRDYPYPVWLDMEGDFAASLAAKAGAVSVIAMDAGTVEDVRFLESAKALGERLAALCGPANAG